jgi:hypothetical protein
MTSNLNLWDPRQSRGRWDAFTKADVVWVCLLASLVPEFLQLFVKVDTPLATLALVCLPITLWCTAKLLTNGASPRSAEDQAALHHPSGVDFFRVIEVVLGLGILFAAIVVAGVVVTVGGLLPLGLLISFALGYLGALGLADLLLHLWGLEAQGPDDSRRLAAAAFGFAVASWVLVLVLSVHPCH